MMEQVRLCAVLPVETWLGSSLTQIQGWTTVRESYSGALEQGTLPAVEQCGAPLRVADPGQDGVLRLFQKLDPRRFEEAAVNSGLYGDGQVQCSVLLVYCVTVGE